MSVFSQTNRVVILDSLQSHKAIIELIDCDIQKIKFEETKEILGLNYKVIDKQNKIILNENLEKSKLNSAIKEKDSIIKLQDESISDQKKTIKKLNTPKNIYKFSFYGALVVIGKLLFF